MNSSDIIIISTSIDKEDYFNDFIVIIFKRRNISFDDVIVSRDRRLFAYKLLIYLCVVAISRHFQSRFPMFQIFSIFLLHRCHKFALLGNNDAI